MRPRGAGRAGDGDDDDDDDIEDVAEDENDVAATAAAAATPGTAAVVEAVVAARRGLGAGHRDSTGPMRGPAAATSDGAETAGADTAEVMVVAKAAARPMGRAPVAREAVLAPARRLQKSPASGRARALAHPCTSALLRPSILKGLRRRRRIRRRRRGRLSRVG
jgi:hypothetical protein